MRKFKEKKKKKSRKKKTLVGKIFRILGLIILTLFILSIIIPLLYRWINPPFTPLMIIRKVTINAPMEYEWRDLEDISPNMIQCAVAAEDNNFLGHNGFDYGAIDKAIEEHKKGKRQRGASTISQQTAKNVFLWPKSSWVRKGCEVYFTILIEHLWSKNRIMEVYLNVIEMGKGIYGAEAAAQHYFNKSADKLSLRQSALITACYPAPLKRNPSKPTKYINSRADKIISVNYMIGTIKFDDKSLEKAQATYEKSKSDFKPIKIFQ